MGRFDIANYLPLPQVRLAGQVEGVEVEIADLRIAGERKNRHCALGGS
ncbi:MAG TPA: hypothetical protein VGR67_12125 [Candidatus Polarisedimenticolia bacterium]|nr:hypothetical protein [Candidatus Polarisedimenticolia bacterium]